MLKSDLITRMLDEFGDQSTSTLVGRFIDEAWLKLTSYVSNPQALKIRRYLPNELVARSSPAVSYGFGDIRVRFDLPQGTKVDGSNIRNNSDTTILTFLDPVLSISEGFDLLEKGTPRHWYYGTDNTDPNVRQILFYPDLEEGATILIAVPVIQVVGEPISNASELPVPDELLPALISLVRSAMHADEENDPAADRHERTALQIIRRYNSMKKPDPPNNQGYFADADIRNYGGSYSPEAPFVRMVNPDS